MAIVTWYLLDDAKLWWQWCYEDIQQGLCTINTWAKLQNELKAQFLLKDVEYIAQRKLRVLQHTTSIKGYVR